MVMAFVFTLQLCFLCGFAWNCIFISRKGIHKVQRRKA